MAGVRFDITGNANGFVGAARQAENAARNMSKSVTNEGKALDDMFKKIAGGMATMAAGLSATALTKKIFDIRSEFQQLEVAFSTMLKSEEKANKLMKDATEFAATTPFDLKGVAAGIKQNLAYGASVDTVIEEMRMLGDVAAGVSMPLNDLVYLYGTLRTSGRVATIDIRQFAGRGIPIYEELAKVLGVAKNEVAGLVTAGKVGFADIEKAFQNMTSAGGMFNNLMANQSKTLQGQFSNLKDNIEMMFNEIGQSTQGVMADAIGFAGKLVENYQEVGRALSVLVAAYGTYKAGLIAVAAIEKVQTTAKAVKHFLELTKTMKMATAAQTAFNAAALANPYVLAAAALATLVAGVIAFTKHKKAEVEAQKEASREVAAEVNEVNTLAAKLKDANTAEGERVKALERLKEIAPDVVDGIDTEAESLDNLTTQLEEYNTLKQLEIALKVSTEYIDFQDTIQSLNDTKAEMQEKKNEIVNVWTDLAKKIKEAIASGGISSDLASYFESFMYDPNVDYVTKIQNVRYAGQGKDLSKEDSKFLREAFMSTRKDAKDYMVAATDLKQAEEAYAKGVEDLRKRIHDSVALVYTDAEEAKKAEETLLVALGLEKPKTTGGGNKDDEKALTAKQQEEAYKRQQAEKKAAESLAKMKRDLNAKVAKADIDSMEEGYVKTMATLKYNLQQEKDAIEEQKNALLKSKRDEALKSWLAEDPEGRKEYQFVYKAELTPEEEAVFAAMGVQAQNEFNKGREKASKQWSKEAEFTTRQFSIDAMSDGASKEAAQRQLDNDKELHNLELQREAYIEAAKAAHILAEEKKMAADPKYLYQMFDADAANANFDKIVADTSHRQKTDEAETAKADWWEYLKEYGTLQQKKEAITAQYNDRIAKATTAGMKLTLMAEMNATLDSLEQTYNKAYQNIFRSPEKMSRATIKSSISLAQSEIKKIQSKGVLSEDDLSNIERLQQAIDNLQGYADSSFWNNFGGGLDGVIAKANQLLSIKKRIELAEKSGDADALKDAEEEQTAAKENLKQNLAGAGVDLFASGLSSAAASMREIADLSGSVRLQELAESFENVSGLVSSVASGAASGGWIGALVGGLTSIFGMIQESLINSQAELVEAKKNADDFADALRRASLELDEENFKSIFGTNQLDYIISAIEKYASIKNEYEKLFSDLKTWAPEDLDPLSSKYAKNYMSMMAGYDKLQGMLIKTHDANRFAEAIGFDEDEYTRLIDLAPELWGPDGVFDTEKAKLFLETNTQLTETQRKEIQNYIDLADAASKARAEIDKWLESFVGETASSLTDAIFDAIDNGGDAWDSFEKKGDEVIRALGKEMLKSMIQADLTSVWSDRLRDAAGDPDALAKEYAAMMEWLKTQSETYSNVANEWESIHGTGSSSTRSATEKGIAQASQESITELNGRATAIQSHTFSINERVGNLVSITAQMLGRVSSIDNKASRLETIERSLDYMRSDISDILTKGIKVKA